MDDHQMVPEDFEKKGKLSPACAEIVLRCLHMARLEQPEILWTLKQTGQVCYVMEQSMWQKDGRDG